MSALTCVSKNYLLTMQVFLPRANQESLPRIKESLWTVYLIDQSGCAFISFTDFNQSFHCFLLSQVDKVCYSFGCVTFY